jgi:hypothetical protein
LSKPRAVVIGEYGGVAADVPGHLWQTHNTNGETKVNDLEHLWTAYRELLDQVRALQAKGLSASVYTQVSDVESETNGVMTYDREVVKLPVAQTAAANKRTIAP